MELHRNIIRYKSAFVHAAKQLKAELGDDNEATLLIMNSLIAATAEFALNCTAEDPDRDQEKFDALNKALFEVFQRFFTDENGQCVLVTIEPERRRKGK